MCCINTNETTTLFICTTHEYDDFVRNNAGHQPGTHDLEVARLALAGRSKSDRASLSTQVLPHAHL
jgi:hypothetical protein